MDRRYKYVSVPVDSILDVLHPAAQPFHNLFRLALPLLPAGYVVLDVRAAPWTKCVEVLIWHPSFPVVPEGESPPRIDGGGIERVLYARLEGDSADVPVYRKVRPAGE